jgi:hypothetical protein
MANVKTPLMSGSAQGTIAQALTFSRRKGRQKVRFQRKQKYDATDNQIPYRLLMAQAVTEWNALTDEQKAVWNAQAQGTTKTGYNLFVSDYLKTTTPPEKRSRYGQRTYGYYEYGRQAL